MRTLCETDLQLLLLVLLGRQEIVCPASLLQGLALNRLHLHGSLCSLLRKCCLLHPLLCRPPQRCLWMSFSLAGHGLFLDDHGQVHILNLQAGQG